MRIVSRQLTAPLALTVGAVVLVLAQPTAAQPELKDTAARQTSHDRHGLARLAGAWRMTELRVGTPGHLKPIPYSGQVVFTRAGTMSVQASNPDPDAPDTAYTVNGYEAFYGSVQVDSRTRTLDVTVESALAKALVGQHLSRRFAVTGNTLILTPSDPTEGFRVTYERIRR